MIKERIDNEKIKFKIIKNDKEGKEELASLKGLNIYIINLMQQLWEQPKLVYLILSNSNIKDIKGNLAYFFCNNFYENILNPNYIEDNLLFVFALLIKKEINNLRSLKDVNIFLMETTCGFLLEQLKERKDVQLYFKKILIDVIEKAEEIFSSKEISFDIKKIEEEIKILRKGKKDPKSLIEKKELNQFYLQKNKEITLNFDEENNEKDKKLDKGNDKKKIFYKKYMLNMTLEDLKKVYNLNEEYQEKDIKDEMKVYINFHIKNSEMNEEMFKNDEFFISVGKSQLAQDILSIYQNMFIGLIEIIDKLLKNLLDNIDLIPYPIKAISKIIILLAKKKFPQITVIELNIFLSNFFLNQLLCNMLNNPSLLLLINNIISENTLNNLKLISSILIKFVSGKFYQNYINECNFIPFNWFFLDEMPKMMKFFKNFSKDINLPLIINKLINGELEKNLTFEYFKEKNEIIGHKSICFSYDDLFILLDNIDRCKNILFIDEKSSLLKKTYDKLNKENAVKILDNIRNNPQYEIIIIQKHKKEKIEIKIPIIKYFLISDLLINHKKSELFKTKGIEDIHINNIYSIKNTICYLFKNYKIIDESDFNISNENMKDICKLNMFDILNKFKQLNNLTDYSFNDEIPENMNITWLIDELTSLNEELKKKDYEDILIELYQKINLSINTISYKDITYCVDKFQIAKRYNNLYEQAKNIILDIDIINKVKNIVDNENIPVGILFNYKKNKKELKIEIPKKVKNNFHSQEKETNFISFESYDNCPTINSFIKAFPDIAIIAILNEDDIFEMHKEMEINKKLENYFKIIETHFSKSINKKDSSNNLSVLSDDNCFFNNEEFEKINLKIKEYIIEKLYEKIFPKNPDFLDNKIYLNSLKLSWTEPKHFLKEQIIGKDNENIDFKRFIGEMKIIMKNIEKEKVPWKKIEFISKIINILDKCFKNKVKINYGQSFFKCLIIYTIVKIQPTNLHSNCLFIKQFIENNQNRTGENMLEILIESCSFFKDISYDNLLGVSEKEFNEKSEKSFNEL